MWAMALWAWESRGVGDLPSADPIVLRSMQWLQVPVNLFSVVGARP